MAKGEVTVNGMSTEQFIAAEKAREIEEHRRTEVRSATKQAAKRCGASNHKLRIRLPGRCARVWLVLLWEKIERLLGQGKTVKEVASECHIRTSTVRDYRRHFGRTLRPAVKAQMVGCDCLGEILRLLAEGKPAKVVAVECCVSVRKVRATAFLSEPMELTGKSANYEEMQQVACFCCGYAQIRGNFPSSAPNILDSRKFQS
jgi:DNA-binding CsgD family transcriptional regulator